MKENLFTDLPITDQAALTLITLIEVVKEKGVPPLPHAWEFPNVRGYAQEREGYPVPYLDLIFHRNSGKPFIRDNAKLFSLHFDYLDHYGHEVSDTFELFFNYYKRNKVTDSWVLDRNTEIDYNSLRSFIDKNFSREHQYNIVHGLGEVLKVIYKYGGVVHRRLHLTGVQYKFLRKKTAVEKLIVDATVFIESVRNLSQVEFNESLVSPVFERDAHLHDLGFTETEFLVTPSREDSALLMEIGSYRNSKVFKLYSDNLRFLLETKISFEVSVNVDYLVDLFERFMSFLVSQDYYVTPNKVYSKKQTYLMHEVDEHAKEIKAILEYFNLHYVYYQTKTSILEDIYCYFY